MPRQQKSNDDVFTYAEERNIAQISVGQVSNFIKAAHRANIENGSRTDREDRITPCLIGHSGVGKTSALRQAARDLNAKLIYLLLQGHRAEDIGGYPYPKIDPETKSVEYIEFARLKEFQFDICSCDHKHDRHESTTIGEGEDAEVQERCTVAGCDCDGYTQVTDWLLFLGELNRSDRDMLQTVFQLVGEGGIDNHRFPLRCTVIVDMNPPQRNYTVTDMDEALLSRLHEVEVRVNVAEWLEYARNNDCHDVVVKHIEGDNDRLLEVESPEWAAGVNKHKPANPRSWMRVSSILHSMRASDPFEIVAPLIAGVVGIENTKQLRRLYDQHGVTYTGRDIVEDYPAIRPKIVEVIGQGRVDLLTSIPSSIVTVLKGINLKNEKELDKASENVARFYLDLEKDMAARFGDQLIEWVNGTEVSDKLRVAWTKKFAFRPDVKSRLEEMKAVRDAARQDDFLSDDQGGVDQAMSL